MILRRVTEKMIKRRPVMAPVKSSLPFFTCSALSPPVMIWTVAASMTTSEIAPAVPARKVRREEVKPVVSKGIQPRAVSIPVPPLQVGSMAWAKLGDRRPADAKAMAGKYVRIEIWFLSGQNFFIQG